VAAALAIGIAAFGSALGQGNVASKALGGMARQPEAAGMLRTNMILALAFIESLSIYALVIAFLLAAKI
jgi:F-type H+-transporting ATPase subunit c